MALPQFKMSDLLAAGVHYGHRTFRWNPQLAPYIYGTRNGIHIIDLQQTVPMIYQGLSVLRNTVSNGGRVLFVGTKRQAQEPVREAANRCGMYYVNHRWLGGMLTNWKTINQSIKLLKEIEEQFEKDAKATAHYEEQMKTWQEGDVKPKNLSPLAHLTKKERLMKQRQLEKLDLVLGGIKDMNGLPDVIVVLDVKKDNIAIKEAKCLGIPVIGIVDTNSTLENVTYPIMGNDDAARSINLYCQLFSDSVLDGIAAQAERVQSRAKPVSSVKSGTASNKATAGVTLSPKAQEAAEKEEAKAVEEAAVAAEKPAEETQAAAS
ncbi:MAG: 30S ribosomal protein S2 [Alphaproteobacteria bacterium]|nr:30S ribosomal protein S2 [Alphaproteobacteria bacterium]MDD9920128.1 30S ribosomal protein S2 [Alphaproteobacteria bacterium]